MKRQHIYYLLLISLFAVAVVYQARFSYGRIKYLMNVADQGISWPINTSRLGPTITFVNESLKDSGIHRGDELLSINGKPYTGRGVMFDQLSDARPGDSLIVKVRHPEGEASPAEQDVTVQLASAQLDRPSVWEMAFILVLSLATPIFCLLLGFGVVALRPRDPVAWLLLGLLLSVGQVFLGVAFDEWRGWLRDVMVIYQTSVRTTWPLWMLLFGIYFPERLDLDRRWPWLKWILIIPNVVFILEEIVVNVASLRSFAVAAPLYRAFQPFGIIQTIVKMVSIGSFFAALGYKGGTVTNPDVRRRLRLLQIGTTVSMTPTFLILIWSFIKGAPPQQAAPIWIGFPSIMLFFLFPLTFAYVILVHRALDIRVVIRQGVRYAFARGGVVVLRALIIIAILLVMISEINKPDARRVDIYLTIGVGVTLILLMRRLGERLIAWTDRRFFREAYNSEQILSELGEKVRTMVETGPLLETVAHRISESLHVPRVALLVASDGAYRPAYAIGYEKPLDVSFSEKAATAERLKQEGEPLRVYFDDEDSWVNRTPEVDGERGMLKELDSQLLLPLAVKERLPGFISLGPKQSEEPYTNTDLRLLQSVATQAGLALENSRLTERIAAEVAQRERLNRELEIAREVQERLFPQKLPSISGMDYCGACRPALGVGGDYYDFLLLPADQFGIAIGDVSGKGIAAALLMASLQASLRSQAIQETDDVAGLMGNVNRLVYDASAENRYATFFYAQYEPSTRNLTYVNAGHNPPAVLRKKGDEWEIIRLDAGGAVVGLLRSFPYSQASVTLEPGDTLVAFTDGISEAMNPAEEEWGEENLIEAMKDCQGLSASDTIARIIEAADRFAAGAKQHDDMTLIVVRII
jgi:sigma-B regulation protein RsbU (phosphoserine phosphatase)